VIVAALVGIFAGLSFNITWVEQMYYVKTKDEHVF
jgi:hypothetical protein